MPPMTRKYFVCANSSAGFYSFFHENLADFDRVYILKAGPGTGKSTLMSRLGAYFLKAGYDIEQIHCSSSPESLDGLIIPALKVAVVDGTQPHVIEPTAPGALEQYVNLGVAWNLDFLSQHREEILQLRLEAANAYKRLYDQFAKALAIHDQWEKIYIDAMDFEKAAAFRQLICDTLLDYPPTHRTAKVKHRFFGATTPTGSVDFIMNLTEPLSKRYFIKGRPGTGKSTLLREVAKTATQLGYDTEIYHCSFDPDSLDMVLIPGLSLAFFDSTAPHEYEPSRDGDQIIDTYKVFIRAGTDEENSEAIALLQSQYQDEVAKGRAALKEAQDAHRQLETLYIQATNFDILDGFYEQLKDNINGLRK